MAQKEMLVYVIDDDASVRRAFELLLRSAGFSVQAFASAEAFLENGGPSDNGVTILDMRMPGMTGLELIKKLASQKNRVKIIAVSGYDDAPTRERAGKLGAVAFFRKPVDDQALIDAIEWAALTTRS
jgi:FixJ family two-component response regulator